MNNHLRKALADLVAAQPAWNPAVAPAAFKACLQAEEALQHSSPPEQHDDIPDLPQQLRFGCGHHAYCTNCGEHHNTVEDGRGGRICRGCSEKRYLEEVKSYARDLRAALILARRTNQSARQVKEAQPRRRPSAPDNLRNESQNETERR